MQNEDKEINFRAKEQKEEVDKPKKEPINNPDLAQQYRSLSKKILAEDHINTKERQDEVMQILRNIVEKYGDKGKDFVRIFLEELKAKDN